MIHKYEFVYDSEKYISKTIKRIFVDTEIKV